MPAPIACCNSCDPESVVEIPGTQGASGADGADGQGAYTTTLADFVIPATNANVSNPDGFVYLANTSWLVVGQTIFISDDVDGATFEVMSVAVGKISAKALGHTGDTAAGSTINTGAKAVAAGTQPPLAAALPTAVVDVGLTGAPVNAVNTAAFQIGCAESTLTINFVASAITGNVLLYTNTPGHRFRIRKISASCVGAVTTGAKAATLTTAIGGTPTTGGIVILSGAYALGSQQASSAGITAADTGTSAQAITITASSVTAFIEGAFCVHITIQNLDTADALVTLSKHVNDLITALT